MKWIVAFLSLGALVAVGGTLWELGVVTDWHFGAYCVTPDNCSGAPDVGVAVARWVLIAVLVVTVAGIGAWRLRQRARLRPKD